MLLTIQAELSPGADLGYLLHKHPERHFCAEQPVGRVHVFFPEIGPDGATAALWLEVDPVGLVRRRKQGEGPSIDQYVNDRPYVASSQLSVAISRCLGTALNGKCQDRPLLAETPLELKVTVAVVASRWSTRSKPSATGSTATSPTGVRAPITPSGSRAANL